VKTDESLDELDLRLTWTNRMCVLATGASTRRKVRTMKATKTATPPLAMTCATQAARLRRVRVMPARDRRGRFVSGPRSEAPSWYVLSADAYRIPGEPPAEPPAVPAPIKRPIAAPRRRDSLERRRTRDLLHSALLVLIILVASGCYAAHLFAARPHL